MPALRSTVGLTGGRTCSGGPLMHTEAHHGMLKFVQIGKVKYLYGREKEGLCLKEQPRLESRTLLTMNSKYPGETHAGPHVKCSEWLHFLSRPLQTSEFRVQTHVCLADFSPERRLADFWSWQRLQRSFPVSLFLWTHENRSAPSG